MNTINQTNIAQSAFYAAHPREDARPTWDDLTPAERDEERQRGEDSEFFHDFTGWCRDDCEAPQTKGEDGLGGCGHPVIADNERI